MKFAYSDPPYIGQAKKLYDCPEIDHKAMIEQMVEVYPDGWALSLSSPTLREVLNLCPRDVRVAAWCKSFCAFKKGVRPAYAWEPIVYWRGRNPPNGHRHLPPEKNGKQTTPKDFIIEPITLQKGLTGAKPARVCDWILDLLNAKPEDTIVDLFPGTRSLEKAAERKGLVYVASVDRQRVHVSASQESELATLWAGRVI